MVSIARSTVTLLSVLTAISVCSTAYADTDGWRKFDPANSFTLHVAPASPSTSDTAITLESTQATAHQFAAATHTIPAKDFQGKLALLKGKITTDSAATGAILWISVKSGAKQVGFSNTESNPVPENSQNIPRQTTLSIPTDATEINYGFALKGAGKATVTALSINIQAQTQAVGAASPLSVMQAAITDIETYAYNADRIDWSTQKSALLSFAQTASQQDVYQKLQIVLKRLSDHHSFIIPPWKITEFFNKPPILPTLTAYSADIQCITLPSFSSDQAQSKSAYQKAVFDALQSSGSTKGWIIDLRQNRGGNMWPMLASLKPFLGDGVLGYFVNKKGEKSAGWKAQPDKALSLPTDQSLLTAPVAVLIGSQTASSGEAVAIAFKGRPNTRFFGTATAGHASANRTFFLPDGGRMMLTASIDADRTGKLYGHDVIPDEATQNDEATLTAATNWMKHQISP